eukprot:CAMPEP_0197184316 /NCGR_PEP_ID=MMETSP1423-20130617/9626_1 /TAXON_ID=476441 /ORGANISM="Pseudo-nitzschia heimii, Strain UNC1101" /LENGTH=125 /DNA_ID=CAMNT_0042635103 /DNA_START=56 /DNA_END=433 /DNA_ORIENTATION=+
MSSMFGFGSRSDDIAQSQSKTKMTDSSTERKQDIKPVVNKRRMIEEVASTHDLSYAKSERIVNTLFDTIVEAVVDGKQVRLSNFGSFESYMSKARRGINPNSGEAIEIASKRRIRFKAYDAFKKA